MKTYPGADLMRELLTPAQKPGKAILDSASDEGSNVAGDYAMADIRMKAGATLMQWAATEPDDLGEGETLADRLLAMTVGIVDADKDGELDEDEQAVAEAALSAMWDFMVAKGCSEDDCDALLNQWDADAAARCKDLLSEAAGSDEDLDAFAFDADAEAAVFDSAGEMVLDAVYKKKVVVRGGKKVRINKRISGRVRLSAKQKIAVRKMLRKSHSASATLRRMKSVRVRKAAGL